MPNKKDKYLKIFTQIGLSDKEASVYLASLNLGSASALKISQASDIKRTTTYSTIESLIKKGLMSIEFRGLKKYYTPEDPNNLTMMIDNKKKILENNIDDISKLYNQTGQEESIKKYIDKPAVKNVYEKIISEIKPHDDYFVISDTQQIMEFDKDFFINFSKKRAKKNTNLKLLLIDSPQTRKLYPFAKNFNSQVKILPKNIFFNTNLTILPNKIIIHQMKMPFSCVVIENKETVHFFHELFLVLWNLL